MKKLLMLGSSYGTVEMLRYAKSIGVYTIVTDYNEPEKSIGKKVSDEYWMISTADVDAIEHRCKEEGVDAIFSPVSEFNLDRNIELCDRLNLPFYCSKDTWLYSRSKRAFKDACIRNGAPVAEDYYLSDHLTKEEIRKVQYPVVVKPNDLCGGRGMSYCHNQDELITAYYTARSLSKYEPIIVEKMLEGRRFSAYYVLADGEVRLLNVNEELSPEGCSPALCVVHICFTDYFERFLSEINPCIERVLKSIGCREGVVWVELMLDKDGHFYILELGHRLSGDMVERTYPELFGFDAYKWMIDLSLGKQHTVFELPPIQQHMPISMVGGTYLLRSKKTTTIAEVTGIENALNIPGVEYSMMRQSGNGIKEEEAIGIFSITAVSVTQFCNKLRKINELIQVLDENGNTILYRYDDYSFLLNLYKRGLLMCNQEY